MRAQEFIVEYTRQQTAQNWGQKLLAAARKDNTLPPKLKKLGQEAVLVDTILQQLETADPTKNKEYTQGLAKLYANGGLKIEDATSTLADYLTKFHTLKIKRIIPSPYNDFLKYSNVRDFMSTMDKYSVPDTNNKEVNRGQAKEIYNDAQVRVIQPEDTTAACYYGQGTRWCTAAKNNNMFDYYADDSPLYIIIPKKPTHPGEKYQIHFDSGQFKDANDDDADMDAVVDRYPQLGTLFHEEAQEYGYDDIFAPPQAREAQKQRQIAEGNKIIKDIGIDQGNGIVTVNLNSYSSEDETAPWIAYPVGRAVTGGSLPGIPGEYDQGDGDRHLHSYAVIDTQTKEMAIVYAAKPWHGDVEDDVEPHIGPDFTRARAGGVDNPRIMAVAKPLLQDLVKYGVLTHQARAADDIADEKTDPSNNVALQQAYQQLITKYGAPYNEEHAMSEKLGDNRPTLGSKRDQGKSVRKWRRQRGLDESKELSGILKNAGLKTSD